MAQPGCPVHQRTDPSNLVTPFGETVEMSKLGCMCFFTIDGYASSMDFKVLEVRDGILKAVDCEFQVWVELVEFLEHRIHLVWLHHKQSIVYIPCIEFKGSVAHPRHLQ